jgi:3-oxoacyl-[acyl-carrier protein] reductase
MAFDLDGKVALVTGGGRGIGAAICRRLAEAGAVVVVANRTIEVAETVASEIQAAGGQASAIGFDDLSRQGIADLVAAIITENGRLDIVVHNAGVCPWAGILQLDEDTLAETLSVNLSACFWLAQASVPHMQQQGNGRFLVTSSVTGPKVALPGAAHYAAAKAGVNGFIKSAALEFAQFGITVNGVEPGFIAKPGRGSTLSDADKEARINSFIPLGGMGEADDIACAMLYLASDEARFMTGQTLVLDGGALLPETGYALDLMDRVNQSPKT